MKRNFPACCFFSFLGIQGHLRAEPGEAMMSEAPKNEKKDAMVSSCMISNEERRRKMKMMIKLDKIIERRTRKFFL